MNEGNFSYLYRLRKLLLIYSTITKDMVHLNKSFKGGFDFSPSMKRLHELIAAELQAMPSVQVTRTTLIEREIRLKFPDIGKRRNFHVYSNGIVQYRSVCEMVVDFPTMRDWFLGFIPMYTRRKNLIDVYNRLCQNDDIDQPLLQNWDYLFYERRVERRRRLYDLVIVARKSFLDQYHDAVKDERGLVYGEFATPEAEDFMESHVEQFGRG